MRKYRWLTTSLLISMLLLLVGLCQCTRVLERYEETRPMMGTYVKVVIYSEVNVAEEAINAAFSRMEEIEKIVDIQIRGLAEILSSKKLSIEVSGRAKKLLAKEGFDPVYGARPLKRVIQNEVQNVLALKLLSGEIKEGDSVSVDVTGPEGRVLDFKVK